MKHLLVLLAVMAVTAPVGATDLTKIDRTIKKEPAYEVKPKYCLLVFGPEAKTRVWLILDGDTLFLGRDGDLRKVKLPPLKAEEKEGWATGMREAKIGAAVEGKYTDLVLYQ